MQKYLFPHNGSFLSTATAIEMLSSPASRANCAKSLNINYAVRVFLLFLTCSLLIGVASAQTIDVGTSGYTYNDISNAIASATSGDSVHVHSGTYTISAPILMKSGITLYGDGVNSTIIKMDNRDHFKSSASSGAIICSSVNNVVIYGLSVTGGEASLSSMYGLSNSYRDFCQGISIKNSNTITIHDFNYYLGMGDCVHGANSNTITIYNCVFDTPGHDGIDCWTGNNWHIYNVKIDTFINTCIKPATATNMVIDHSTFYCTESVHSGYCGVEIMQGGNSITIDHCVFGPMLNSQSKGVTTDDADNSVGGTCAINNCIFYQCTGGNYVYNGDHTLTYTTSNIQTPSSLNWALWASEGFGYGATGYSSGGDSSLPAYNGSALPTLSVPANGSTTTVNGNITYQWSDVNSTSYRIQVSNVSNFSTTLYNTTTSSNAISLGMSNGSYYWRISAHIDAGANAGTWTSYTTANSFTISGNVNSTGGLYGTIYDTQVGNGIQGAVVTIINKDNNESKIAVTDADGFYSFSDIGGSGVWYMTVSATDYQGTSWQLPVDVSSTYERKDVALVKSANYFLPNYVTFSVTDIWLNQYSGVTATVYQSDLVIDTKQTDMYGKVQFKLDKNIEYTITFVDPTQNINTRRTIVPTDSMYWIVVWGATKNTDVNTSQDQNAEPAQLPRDSDYIKYGVGQATKNISYSYIVVGINATSSASNITGWSTSVAEVYPSNDTVMTDANNSTLNYSVTVVGFGNSTTKIEVPSGRTYKVYSQIASDKLSQPVYKQDFITITESGVRSDLDFGFEDQWNYEALGYACMLLIAGLFGQRSMNVGALLLILMGSFFTYERWFPSNAGTLMMNGLAIIAFVAYSMTRRD